MTVLAVVSSSIDGVVRCVEALVDCVDRAEKSGLSCDVVVIDPSGDQRIAEFLDAVDGLLRIGVEDDLTARTAFLAQGHTRNGPLFCLDTTAAPGAGALELLVGAAPHPGWCAVADDRDPAPYAVLHAADLGFRNPVRDDEDLVPGLVSRAAAAGVSVVGVAGAGMIREPSRGERPWGATVVGPGRVRVGVASYSGHDTVVKTYAPLEEVEIGSYCSLANEVRLVLPGGRLFDDDGAEVLLDLRGLHRMETATTFPIGVLVPDEPYELPGDEHRGEKMIIGDDVWIGYRATVVGAVRIGAGAVVGAGSVVVSDVPAYTVVGGVPARVIRPRFDARHAEALQRIRWWDWPVETVRGSHRQFLRPVEDFVAHFDLSTFVTVPVEES